jgi:hypothetical protein
VVPTRGGKESSLKPLSFFKIASDINLKEKVAMSWGRQKNRFACVTL